MSALLDRKVIVSHLLPPMPNDGHLVPSTTVKEITYMAFRTRYAGKTIITGLGIGRVDKDGLKTTETANNVARAMAKAPEFSGRLVECRNSNTANKRVVTALKAAQDGDGLLIVCKNDTVYDDVQIYKLLGVEKTPVE
jgi:hypothetical protein